jgi:cell division protein ZapA (FtsZ GTPase activity inhibitor)
MSELISIKVPIADKVFPLKVSAEEEQNVRKAADLINKKIKTYIEQYAIKDKQAALSMCALELATEMLNNESQKTEEQNGIIWKLLELDSLLNNS